MKVGAVGVTLAALVAVGCLVEIDHVSDPGPAFARARAEAERLQGRPGPAHRLNVLVFDHEEGQLVRVSLPMWMVRRIEHGSEHAGREGFDFDADEGERIERHLRRHLRLEEIEKAGLGVLVEVEEDGGDQVLIWLQ